MTTLPQKTRELHNHHFDSTIWNDFEFRDDDIIISTYAKSLQVGWALSSGGHRCGWIARTIWLP